MKLVGKRVVIAGSRRAKAWSKMIQHRGGEPLLRPLQITQFATKDETKKQIQLILQKPVDWFIFTTGMGIEILFRRARQLNLEQALLEQMSHSRIAGHGYKVIRALKRLDHYINKQGQHRALQPWYPALFDHSLNYKRVIVQSYGESPWMPHFLDEVQADWDLIIPYSYLPPDPKVINQLIYEIENREIDIILFTSKEQVKNLFAYTNQSATTKQLLHGFAKNMIVCAAGMGVAQTLHDHGVTQVITAPAQQMGHLIADLANRSQKEASAVWR